MTRVTVVGLPAGGSLSLSCDASKAIAEAQVVAGGKRQLQWLAEHTAVAADIAPATVSASVQRQLGPAGSRQAAKRRLLPSDPDNEATGAKLQIGCIAQRIVLASDIEASIARIRRATEAGKRVVVLASGDPLLFGIGASLVNELGAERVRILPAVSSVQLAFARIGQPWHDATVLSAHGRPSSGILPQALTASKLAILTDGTSTPSAIAEALLEAGLEDCRAVVAENLGTPNEHVTDTTLAALPGRELGPLNVLLVLREPGLARQRFGEPDGEFESVRGQITKAEVRAVALSKLRLASEGIFWDIGSGSGSVAIEAARLMPRGTVYAVERDPEQLACLRRNLARHHASNVHVVADEAPGALAGLPKPHSVFVGGTGGRLEALLEAVPRPFVANLAILEHVSLVLSRFPGAEVVQVAISRSEPIGGGHRLVAQNPVYVVSVHA